MLDTALMLKRQTQRTVIVALVFGVGSIVWSGFAPLEGAVTSSGTLVLENDVKNVQHPTGGVVSEVRAVEGQRVQAGDILLRLDEISTRANLAVIMNDLTTGIARRARLLAERDGQANLEFPKELLDRAASEPEVAAMIDSEQKLFISRATSRRGQKDQLAEKVGQTRREIEGLELQKSSMDIQLQVARDELAPLKDLEAQRLVPRTRITTLDREIARNEGALGDTIARIAQSRGRIAETEIQIQQIDRDKEAEANKELRETETKISEQRERRIAAEDLLRRVDIRAPISGTIQQSTVHTIGGVIQPKDVLMVIVPEADQLIIETHVKPQDRDQLVLDQPTRVRFSSFNQRTTPELQGTVFRISGDVIRDTHTGQNYYNVGVRVSADELAKLNGARLAAGMPADAFFKTTDRTLMSYLLKPLTDHWQSTFTGH